MRWWELHGELWRFVEGDEDLKKAAVMDERIYMLYSPIYLALPAA